MRHRILITFSKPHSVGRGKTLRIRQLSEDWEIIFLTNTKIELRHVSGGNGGADILTFEKV